MAESGSTNLGNRSRRVGLRGAASLVLFLAAAAAALYVGARLRPAWSVAEVSLDVQADAAGGLSYAFGGKRYALDPSAVPDAAEARRAIDGRLARGEILHEELVAQRTTSDGELLYVRFVVQRHWGLWSLLPAVIAIALCWLTAEPLIALVAGVVVGALLLGKYDLTREGLIASLATESAASVLLLYLVLLGGLLGVWRATGGAQAFAEFMTRRFVRGPRSAKLVAWGVGVAFFQGGSVSTVLTGTTVRPVADQERVSHEELAYIVDSTASPIASLLAFNAWPGYVQGFIFVAGVPWLATEADRIRFFFASIPLCFYAILAVCFTFLMSLDILPWIGRRMREAMERARTTGQLDRPGAEPLASPELMASCVPAGYRPHVAEFFVPLATLIAVAVGTFATGGTPQVHWAFGAALVVAAGTALVRGMTLRQLCEGIVGGLKGAVLGAVILLLAVTIGQLSSEAGGGAYLVDLLGDRIPYWLLPVMLQLLTMIIAFSTGTSWGTYAVAFPLAMPLAWAVAGESSLAHPYFYMMICFAAVMDGSVYGDQCSPISDTTVLSAMCTGCDLMDHVKTQLPQASIAAALAAVGWTVLAWLA